jgi:hypothetical protein
VVLVTAQFFLSAAAPPPRPDPEVAKLIAKLGDDEWEVREDASRELKKLGSRAKRQVKKATACNDAEVRRLSRWILSHILSEECWTPFVAEVSVKGTRLSKVMETVADKFETPIEWAPRYPAGERPSDVTIDFTAKGTLPEVLDKLGAAAKVRFDPSRSSGGSLRLGKARVVPVLKKNFGNLWVQLEGTPLDMGDGTISVWCQIVSGAQQPLHALDHPVKIHKAVTDSGEELKHVTRGHSRQNLSGPSIFVETELQLEKPKKPSKRIKVLDVEFSISALGSRVVSRCTAIDKPSELTEHGATFKFQGLRNYGDLGAIQEWLFTVSGPFHGNPEIFALNGEGKRLQAYYVRVDRSRKPVVCSAYFDARAAGKVERIDVRYFSCVGSRSLRMTFKDLGIPKSD